MKSTLKFLAFFLLIIFSLSIVFCSVQIPFGVQDNYDTIPNDDLIEDETIESDITSENPPSNSELAIDFSNEIYYAFGDSITYGADYSLQYAQMAYPYPDLVSSTLGLKSFTNYAVSGSTIATDVGGLPNIYNQLLYADTDADIVSVMGGVNDYNRGVELGTISDTTTNTFYGSLKSICEVLLSKYPDAFVFIMTPYKEHCYHESACTNPNAAGYNLEDYANAVKEVAEIYDIPVLDMYNQGKYELEMYNPSSDGIHPSQEFIKRYTAPQIAEFIRQNYRGK